MARVRDLIGMEEAAALGVRAGLPADLFQDMARRGLVELYERGGCLMVRRSEVEEWCRVHGPRPRPVALRNAS